MTESRAESCWRKPSWAFERLVYVRDAEFRFRNMDPLDASPLEHMLAVSALRSDGDLSPRVYDPWRVFISSTQPDTRLSRADLAH